MRKAILLLAALMALVGCSSPGSSEPASPLEGRAGVYETTMNISYRELRATATISQQTPDACTVTFTSPASLGDMAFVFQKDAVDVRYKGLGFQFDPGSVPGGAVAKIAVGAINQSLQGDGVQIALTDDGMVLSGTLEAGEFLLRLDPEEGNLLKLLVPGEDLEIEFLNFRFLD